jgi:hypothetical protein
MTLDLTVPLTAVWAARQLYSKQQLAGMKEFNLHLVGAAHFEHEHVRTFCFGGLPPAIWFDLFLEACRQQSGLTCFWRLAVSNLV